MKFGVNNPCPCGSGTKFKKCCLNKGIDFSTLSIDEYMRHLSIRGKNLFFINRIAEAIQYDSTPSENTTFWDFVANLKKSITPKAVRDIHLAVSEIWPDGEDLNRCLTAEKENHSGLFLGSYLVDVTVDLLNRHAMYNQTIILIDPFMDPRVVAPEYNPVNKPEEHITTTFHYVLLWLQLLPWIEAGIIKIIRDPGDFNYNLKKSSWEKSRGKVEKYPELKTALENQAHPQKMEDFFKDQFVLSHSEDFWVDKMKDDELLDEKYVRQYFRQKKAESLYYVDVNCTSQFLHWTSGTNYEMGKYICEMTGSHIITDLNYRWKEMTLDRKVNGVEINDWSTFSKAFQDSKVKHLNGLAFNDLLRLRNDGYLDNMRAFLRRVWSACSSGDPFSNNDVENLSAELIGHINQADAEWKKIDANLIKWFGGESILGGAIGVSLGTANWIPAAAIASAGAVNLLMANYDRRTFINKYPAGFFIESIRENT